MLTISIDGACRRNGKPDCVASGGVFIAESIDDVLSDVEVTTTISNYELKSTNQRGELLALLAALDHIWSAKQDALIVTDSEYLFNAMQKEWYRGWFARDWKTATGEPVKNKDIWQNIRQVYLKCVETNLEVTFHHIKGHVIPFGKVTANGLLNVDPTGKKLFYEVSKKYDTVVDKYRDKLDAANDLSLRNNGYTLDEYILKRLVVMNVVADAIATKCVDAADALMARAVTNGS